MHASFTMDGGGILDIGAHMLNYRVATSSYRETLPLLGGQTPITASTLAMGRWMARWLRRSYAGARRHLSHSLRTASESSPHLLHLPPLQPILPWNLRHHARSLRMAPSVASDHAAIALSLGTHVPQAGDRHAAGDSFSHLASICKRGAPLLNRSGPWLQGIIGWLLFDGQAIAHPSSLAWQHWTGPRATDRSTAATRRANAS